MRLKTPIRAGLAAATLIAGALLLSHVGLRGPVEAERERLDITDHGERAYTM